MTLHLGLPVNFPGGDCRDDHFCDASDVCQPQLPAGAACSEHEECLSWDCVGSVCEADTEDFCGDMLSFDW